MKMVGSPAYVASKLDIDRRIEKIRLKNTIPRGGGAKTPPKSFPTRHHYDVPYISLGKTWLAPPSLVMMSETDSPPTTTTQRCGVVACMLYSSHIARR